MVVIFTRLALYYAFAQRVTPVCSYALQLTHSLDANRRSSSSWEPLFFLDTMRAAGFGYLLHRGKEYQHAHCCQHAAVYLTDGRSDEPADDEQEADGEGYV